MTNQLQFLFIHGAGGTNSKWRYIRPNFSDVHAHFINLPGHGDNRDDPCASIEEYADRLSLQIQDDVLVIGHSMGGLIGIELAKRSKKVKGLVLVSSHYHLPVHSSLLEQLSQGTFPEKFFYASYDKSIDEKLLEEEKAEISLVQIDTTYRDYMCCEQYSNGCEVISALNIPIMGLYGSADRMLPKDAEEAIQRSNAGVISETVEGAAHYMMIEQPEMLTTHLRRFYTSFVYRGERR